MIDRRAFVSGLLLLAAGCKSSSHDIVVGSKNFTEQLILGEMFAQMLEQSCHAAVDRRFYLAGTYICQQAILRAGSTSIPNTPAPRWRPCLSKRPRAMRRKCMKK